MTANDLYTWAYGFQSVVAICSISFFTDRVRTLKQKRIVVIVVIVCLVLGVWLNHEGKEKELISAKESEAQANKKYDSLLIIFNQQKSLLNKAVSKLNSIEDALNDKNLRWDSTHGTITEIKSKVYMQNPIINGGRNQFGDGNTQNNH